MSALRRIEACVATCITVALSQVLLASNEQSDLSARFAWGDYNRDGKLDLAAVSERGELQLLRNLGAGRFEDVTAEVGLGSIKQAELALWGDCDGDESLDLFIGRREGPSMLFRNDGEDSGSFTDVSQMSGLVCEGNVRFASWLDHDGDGRMDLHVVSAHKSLLFQGKEGGIFERTELPTNTASIPTFLGDMAASEEPSHNGKQVQARKLGSLPPAQRWQPASGFLQSSPPSGDSPLELGISTLNCVLAIRDQANPGSCVVASSVPALGSLHPLSEDLFVAPSGEVGIGTTSPTARLHVAGTALVTDTVTLAPSNDQALNVSAGSIYKSGALFIHTKGIENTAVGRDALASVSSGDGNTAVGERALQFTTSGFWNTATGYLALRNNTTGRRNTANGTFALANTTTGYSNTASGVFALYLNTSGRHNTAQGTYALLNNTTGNSNTASGARSLEYNTTGSFNTAVGRIALASNTTGSYNTACGSQALQGNTTGSHNTASGWFAMLDNTTGYRNTASGVEALRFNTAGRNNTAHGADALRSNRTGLYNTASGENALRSNLAGSSNTAIGARALFANSGSGNIGVGARAGWYSTIGSDNIAIGNPGEAYESSTIRMGTAGTHTRAFIAGIRGVTTGAADAIPVLVDSAGQLGTVSSSARFKEEIADMGELTQRLLDLRPVVFRYKEEVQRGERPLEYGLIAEEVAEVFPELVVYDKEGKPFTVKYHLLSSMLLNELKTIHEQLGRQTQILQRQETRLAALESRSARAVADGENRP
jgi:hypothetical protein